MVEQGRALINQGMLWSNFEGKIHMRFLVPNGNDISNYNSIKRIILSSISLKLIWNIFIKTNRASQKKKKFILTFDYGSLSSPSVHSDQARLPYGAAGDGG